MKNKTLIFFTSSYPFGYSEAFIESEIEILSRHFDKVIIVSNAKDNSITRPVPDNVSVKYFPYHLNGFEKIIASFGVYSALYKAEIKHIKENLGLEINSMIHKILLSSLYKAEKINRFIRNTAPKNSHIYLYSYWMNDMAAGCAYAKMKNDNFFALSRAHGWDVYMERHNPPYLPLRPFISAYSDKICFISKQGHHYFISKNKTINNENLTYAYLGTKKPDVVKPYTPDGIFHIVSCSTVIPLKQLHKIAESLCLLNTEKKIKWTHLGGGPKEKELLALSSKLFEEKNNISFTLTGSISNNMVHKFYEENKVDLFINTSSTEGLPVSIMEAFSYGIPAIAPNIGGIEEIIDSENNGFVLSHMPEITEIAKAINKMLDLSSSQYLYFRQNAFLKWQSHFDASKNFEKFKTYFDVLPKEEKEEKQNNNAQTFSSCPTCFYKPGNYKKI